MIADLLDALVRANLAAAAAILVVLLARRPVRRAFGARAAYWLWLLPPLMALAALAPAPQPGAWYAAPLVVAAPSLLPAGPAAQMPADWRAIAVAAWALGALICAGLLLAMQLRFTAALGRLRPDARLGRPVLRSPRDGAGPAIVGASIVVPADFETRFTPQEQDAILAHERAHLARGDVLANAGSALAQCLCWFNPLVHLAAFQARLDQELACDATVVEARPALRRSYAEALLKTQLLPSVPPVGCTWPSRAQHPLKERIAMLKSSPPTRLRRGLAAALLAALSLGGGYAAWAAQGEPALVTAPDWVSRPTGEDMAAFYPAEAARQELDGMTTLECRVEVSGTVSGCKAISEAPQGAGFGDAALQLAAAKFRMKPMAKDGKPTAGGIVRIPIMFRVARGPAPAPAQ